MTPDVNEAAGRLRRYDQFGDDKESAEYEVYDNNHHGPFNDMVTLADAYLRLDDPTPITEEFVAGIGEVKHGSNGWFADITDAMRISCFDGRLRMCLWREGSVKAEIDITNPTISDYHACCRLFGITLTPTGADGHEQVA